MTDRITLTQAKVYWDKGYVVQELKHIEGTYDESEWVNWDGVSSGIDYGQECYRIVYVPLMRNK